MLAVGQLTWQGDQMNKNNIITIASFSAIFGLILGVCGVSIVWMQANFNFSRSGSEAKTETGIVSKVELLQKLRSGRYGDATRQVEASLDNDLVSAGELARSGEALSASMLNAIETERSARAVSGYEPSNARVSAAVQEAFRLLPRANGEPAVRPVALEEDSVR